MSKKIKKSEFRQEKFREKSLQCKKINKQYK